MDVGCFHPKKFSNTYYLYKKGWRGINIDIDPIKIEGFKMARPNDMNFACAITDHDGETDYYSHGFYALTTSLEYEFIKKAKRPSRKKKTKCQKLNTVLQRTKYKNRQIDLLSVDAEGHDLDFKKYKPKIIAVESHHRFYKDFFESDLGVFLEEHGYYLAGWCGLTFIMSRDWHF